MNNNLYLLDCTLRDGGYLNDWNFGHDVLTNVFERQIASAVDFIEIGFLDDRRQFDNNRSIMPHSDDVGRIFGKINKMNATVVAMIDYGTCAIENLTVAENSYLDGIRVIFKKHVMGNALNYCAKIKELGYKVFVQAVSITDYSEEELAQLIQQVNIIKPLALSMVDTYGLLHQDNLMHIFNFMDTHLDLSIALGYHAHNNFQMGYPNSIEILNQKTKRNLFVDASLYGMGKSAGNTPIELISMYMNERFGKKYDTTQMLEAIETNIMDIYAKTPWGYNLFYYISASNKCHPSYTSFLIDKHTLSIKSIFELLARIDAEKKLLYDREHIEKLYLDYQKNEYDDANTIESLKSLLKEKKLLLLGPGKSIGLNQNIIQKYISDNSPVVMSINCIYPQYPIDYLFFTNSKRYSQMTGRLNYPENQNIALIATSNITRTIGNFNYLVNYSSLIDTNTDIPDNSLIMLLKLLINIGSDSIALAGFDGYCENNENYHNTDMEYNFVKNKAKYLNDYVRSFLHKASSDIKIHFVTDSMYLK